jgi:hypothetical protein
MAEAPFSLLAYVRRQFDSDRQQKFDFMTVAGEKIIGVFAAWPEADDNVVVVLAANDRLVVLVVEHLVYIAEHRPADPREAITSTIGKVRDAGAERFGKS